MKRVAFLLVALGVMSSAAGSTAQAAYRYGVTCVQNRTNTEINFTAQVGNEGWQSFTLRPGGERWFSHEYDYQNEDRSPPLRVKFDSDLRESVYYLTYTLGRRAAAGQSCREGKPYAFEYERTNQNFIDLKSLD